MIRWLLWLLAGALLGGIVHLVDGADPAAHRDAGRLFAARRRSRRSTRSRRCRSRRRRTP